MNVLLDHPVADAEVQLAPDDLARLRGMIESFRALHTHRLPLTADELDEIRQVDATPFDAASDDNVQAVLGPFA